MTRKYRIGDVSKLLGIPTQTLHYYEECGFVTPKRDPVSQYRYYDAWDINFLIDAKMYRSYNFTNEEINGVINNYSLTDYQNVFKKKEFNLINEIVRKQKVLDSLIIYNKNLLELEERKGMFKIEMSPQVHFMPYRKKLKYEYINGDDSVMKGNGLRTLVDELPLVMSSFMIDYQELAITDCYSELEYWWGFGMSIEQLIHMDVTNENLLYMVPQKSLNTIFVSYDQEGISKSFYDNIYKKVVNDMGYRINGNPFGNLIAKVHEGDRLVRYNEVWIPVA